MNQTDTRTRIQDVALRMFIDNGYEATSLREIAEDVGVTKAALYYHFKTKDEIVTSLIDDRIAALNELAGLGPDPAADARGPRDLRPQVRRGAAGEPPPRHDAVHGAQPDRAA